MALKEKGRAHGRGPGGSVWAAGTMSGTSFDGVDVALIRTDGVEIDEFGETRSGGD